MILNIDGLDINYICEGEGKDLIVLHGWGCNIDTVMPIVNILKGLVFETWTWWKSLFALSNNEKHKK